MDAEPAAAQPDPTRLDAYDHNAVEARWRRIWSERGDYRTELDNPERPFYNLMMFPYPSAEGLHVGHIIPFAGGDIYGRWRRLMGDTVFEPMGFDAFGIEPSGRGGDSFRRASTTFGLAAATGAGRALLAVLSAAAGPLRPTLRARLLKNPSSAGAVGAAEATRVAGAAAPTCAGPIVSPTSPAIKCAYRDSFVPG